MRITPSPITYTTVYTPTPSPQGRTGTNPNANFVALLQQLIQLVQRYLSGISTVPTPPTTGTTQPPRTVEGISDWMTRSRYVILGSDYTSPPKTITFGNGTELPIVKEETGYMVRGNVPLSNNGTTSAYLTLENGDQVPLSIKTMTAY